MKSWKKEFEISDRDVVLSSPAISISEKYVGIHWEQMSYILVSQSLSTNLNSAITAFQSDSNSEGVWWSEYTTDFNLSTNFLFDDSLGQTRAK